MTQKYITSSTTLPVLILSQFDFQVPVMGRVMIKKVEYHFVAPLDNGNRHPVCYPVSENVARIVERSDKQRTDITKSW